MAAKFKRVVAITLAALCLISSFLVPVSAADSSTTEQTVTQQAIAAAKELLGTISYEEYHKKYSEEPKATQEVVIKGSAYDTDGTTVKDVKIETFDGVEAIVSPESGILSYKVDIPATGLYAIKLNYWPIVDKSTSIQRIFRIDGKVPFSEAYYITLPKIWTTTYDPSFEYEIDGVKRPFKTDMDNNELRGTPDQTPEWREFSLKDVDGFYKDYFEFYFTEGTHTISMEGVAQPMAIESITLYPYEAPVSYDEYKESYSDKTAGGDSIKIEAELPTYTSTNTVYPIEESSSAVTSPSETDRTLLNTIGGDKWQTSGQRVAYTFTVESSGMYQIIPRYIQNINDGMYSSRTIYIYSKGLNEGDDGYYNGIPFDEARELRFNYSTDWQVAPLQYGIVTTDAKGNNQVEYVDIEFYFEAGVEYTIEFEVALGTMSEIVRKIDESLTTINNAYLNIMRLTGAEPDSDRNYYFSTVMPDTIIDLILQSKEIEKVAKELVALAGVKSSNVATLEKITWLLDRMGNDEDEIAKNLKQLKAYIGNLGTWLSDAKTQPLQLDYIVIQAAEAEKPVAEANFFQAFIHELARFWWSFFRNYDRMGATEDTAGAADATEVWLAYGRDQTQVIRNLINNDFTPNHGITVDLKLVAGGTLLPSILSGQGPDVYIGLGDNDVINFAIRGAILPIENNKDFADTALYYKVDENFNTVYDENGQPVRNPNAQFNDAAMLVLGIADADNVMHYYGLPETQSFSMMFIRTDILADLGIDKLDTWDDLLSAATTLSENNMTIGLSTDYKIFLYQSGGELFADDGMRINLNSNAALDSFETMCNMFTQYSFPYKYDFVNRFRTGEMPIGIAGYNGTYNHLIVFATELRGLWEFVPLPGYRDEETGKINNTAVSSVSAIVMINGCDDKEKAWEFMKWHSSAGCQIAYSNEMVAILGDSAKHATANITALSEMPWTNKEFTNLMSQFNNLASIPNYPGAYIIGRYTNFAFLSAYNDMANPVNELLSYVTTINKEITRKRSEFGLETLEVGETLASKRAAWILGDEYGFGSLSEATASQYKAEIDGVKNALNAIETEATFSAYCHDSYIDALRTAGATLAEAAASCANAEDAQILKNIDTYIKTCADALKKYQASYPID